MNSFTARDYWQQQFLAALRPFGLAGAPARQWFRARWDAQPDEDAAAEWAREAAAAEFLAEVGA